MKLNPKQIETVLALDGPRRYEHFIKQVADSEQVWGLYRGGWALASTDEGLPVFPLWPAKEYAELCQQNDWVECEPLSIPLDELIEELFPDLENDGVLIGVFYNSTGDSVIRPVSQLLEDLNNELEKYG